MKLHILGVNGPFPESCGATSGYLLEAENNLLQLDLGCGVLSALTALTAPESMTALLLSHWHYDHVADVPVLMYRLEALKSVLPVYGPADPDSPVYRLVTSSSVFSFTEVVPGQELEFSDVSVRVVDARHPVPAVGWRFSCSGRSFGYTGDTNTLPSLAKDFHGCNTLLADSLFPHTDWSVQKPHLSAKLAAVLAEEAGAGRLILTHHSPLLPVQPRLLEALTVHPDTVLAEPGTCLEL